MLFLPWPLLGSHSTSELPRVQKFMDASTSTGLETIQERYREWACCRISARPLCSYSVRARDSLEVGTVRDVSGTIFHSVFSRRAQPSSIAVERESHQNDYHSFEENRKIPGGKQVFYISWSPILGAQRSRPAFLLST